VLARLAVLAAEHGELVLAGRSLAACLKQVLGIFDRAGDR
jgi:hypothetical protein